MSKPPPHSNLAERQALMQLIAHGEEQVSILLQTEDFYDESHRKIFEAAKEAIEKIGTPDFVYITEKLKTNSRIGEIAPEMVASICDEPYRGPPDGAINTIKRARIARETVQMYRSLAGKNVEELPALLLEHHQHITRLLPERRSQRREELLRAIQDPIPRTPTGFPTFDYINKGGLADGTITIISARPGVGKTTLAANIAINLVTNDVPILFLSLEMSAAEVATRMLCALYSNTEEEIRPKAKEVLEGIKTDFDIRDDVISLPAIAQTIYQSPSKVVFIDYLNLIDVPGGDNWL
ncbi:MAG: DnaB-like helicase C-terminal domain-containing protein, partial [Thermodesulfobacteriota bacterium]